MNTSSTRAFTQIIPYEPRPILINYGIFEAPSEELPEDEDQDEVIE